MRLKRSPWSSWSSLSRWSSWSWSGLAGPTLPGDVVAGLTVGAVVAPQSLAYADLAGMPPVAGLYATVAAMLVYAAVGSSPLISLGPTATSAILAASAGRLVAEDVRPAAVTTVALLAGGIALAAGIARVGFVSSLLSRPVLMGYTAGAAVTIVASQLGNLLGVELEGQRLPTVLADLPDALPDTSWATVGLAAGSLASLLLLQRWSVRIPAALIVAVAATALSVAAGLDDHGVATVGDVPRGLPSLGLPELDGFDLAPLLLPAAAIALVGFAETVGQEQALTAAHARGWPQQPRMPGPVNPNRELGALGAANLASGVCGGFSVSASFSRNALSLRAGGRTRRADLVAVGVVLLILLAVTGVLSRLPMATLAAIVVASVASLVPLRTFRALARLQPDDFVFALVALAGVVVVGILPGLALAVALSIGVLLYRLTTVDSAVLGYVPEEDTWRRLDRHPEAEVMPGVLVVRFSGPLYFANASRLRHEVTELVASANPAPTRVVIDGRTISHIDATAAEVLAELHERLAGQGVELVMAGLRRPALDTFLRSDLVKTMGEPAIVYPTVRSAVRQSP